MAYMGYNLRKRAERPLAVKRPYVRRRRTIGTQTDAPDPARDPSSGVAGEAEPSVTEREALDTAARAVELLKTAERLVVAAPVFSANFYTLFGVMHYASHEAISRRARAVMAALNPDAFRRRYEGMLDEDDDRVRLVKEWFQKANYARSVLSDPAQRRNYDTMGPYDCAHHACAALDMSAMDDVVSGRCLEYIPAAQYVELNRNFCV